MIRALILSLVLFVVSPVFAGEQIVCTDKSGIKKRDFREVVSGYMRFDSGEDAITPQVEYTLLMDFCEIVVVKRNYDFFTKNNEQTFYVKGLSVTSMDGHITYVLYPDYAYFKEVLNGETFSAETTP